ncbi:MAG: PIN domain-containing protein [Coriobacteriia bacterium]|nr:PIN domain-containing protein [Coriobacteriia bacterium]
MSAVALVDTNVLIYAFDDDEQDKRLRALRVLDSLVRDARGAVSAQVLAEFYSVLSRRFRHRLTSEVAAGHVRDWADALTTHDTSVGVVLEALRGAIRYQMPYYDAQIWAVARVNRIPLVLSEDFADGTVIEGVRFANPFAEGFDLDALLTA